MTAPARIQHTQKKAPLPSGEISLHRFLIPLASTRIAFVDLRYQTPLVEALGKQQLLLNGGYWAYRDKERVIQGLLVVNGRQLSAGHKHGGVLEVRQGRARVVRGEAFVLSPDTSLALQCSPRLVDAGKVIPKLEAERRAARTALCVRNDRTQLDAYLTLDAITLPEFAELLRQEGCLEALNLDGGPSTAAVAQLEEGAVSVGRGEELPYGIGFTTQAP